VSAKNPKEEVKEFDVKYSIINVKRDCVSLLFGKKLPTKKYIVKCVSKCVLRNFLVLNVF